MHAYTVAHISYIYIYTYNRQLKGDPPSASAESVPADQQKDEETAADSRQEEPPMEPAAGSPWQDESPAPTPAGRQPECQDAEPTGDLPAPTLPTSPGSTTGEPDVGLGGQGEPSSPAEASPPDGPKQDGGTGASETSAAKEVAETSRHESQAAEDSAMDSGPHATAEELGLDSGSSRDSARYSEDTSQAASGAGEDLECQDAEPTGDLPAPTLPTSSGSTTREPDVGLGGEGEPSSPAKASPPDGPKQDGGTGASETSAAKEVAETSRHETQAAEDSAMDSEPHETAEELGLDSGSSRDSARYSEDTSQAASGAEEDLECQDAEPTGDLPAPTLPTSPGSTTGEPDVGLGGQGEPSSPAEASPPDGPKQDGGTGASETSAAKEVAETSRHETQAAEDSAMDSGPHATAEELGLDSGSSRDSARYSEDTSQAASGAEVDLFGELVSLSPAADGRPARDGQQEVDAVTSEDDLADDYDGSYAAESPEAGSSASAPSHAAVDKDLEGPGPSQDLLPQRSHSASHASSGQDWHAETDSDSAEPDAAAEPKVPSDLGKAIESTTSQRWLQPLEEPSVLESGYSGQWSDPDAGPRHVSKELSEDAYSGQWSEDLA